MSIITSNRTRNPLIALASIFAAGFIISCATNPPPLPQNNPADPQVRGSSRAPRDLLTADETTLAIERQLSATQAYAESAEKMEHDMGNMPGMQHSKMRHEGTQHQTQPKGTKSEKKGLSEEMKKTSDEMKAASDEMKKKSEELKRSVTTYTCPMHPEVESDRPGNCPKCGMKLVPKKEKAHEGH
jgi:seryl-tRNA synthetase